MKTKIFFSAALFLTLITAAQAQTLPTYLPADGLVGWWPFNGNANDESGNGNDGIPTNITYGNDRFGNSNSTMEILGQSNRIVTIQNPTNLNSNKKTFSAWIKFPISLNPGLWYNYIMLCEPPTGYATFMQIMGNNPLYIQDGRMYKFNYTGLGQPQADPSELFNTDTWRHIACIADMDSAMVKFYFDGIYVGSKEITVDQNLTQWNTIKFGNNLSDPNAAFAGTLDDIAIYNRALSQEEITALFTGEPVNPATTCNPLPSNLQNGLVGYWPFCGNANDESGNGNDGTVNGATLTEDRFGVANSAYDFDGVNDLISVANNSSLDVTGLNISISMWINSTNNQNEVLYKGVSKGGYWPQSGYELVFRNSLDGDLGRMEFAGFPGLNSYGTTNFDINSFSSSWYHVVGSLSNGVVEIYINGEIQEVNNEGGFNSLVSNSAPLLIGTRDPSNNLIGFVKGKMDDIGIWNRALTAEEVQQLYTLNACTFSIYDTTFVTIYDTVSVSTTDTLTINTLITGVQPAQENTFLVYPNPAGSQITINNGNVSILGGYTMRISNSIGQEVYNQNITQTEVTLDLSNWGGNGLYVLYILDPQGEIIAVKQIVLQ